MCPRCNTSMHALLYCPHIVKHVSSNMLLPCPLQGNPPPRSQLWQPQQWQLVSSCSLEPTKAACNRIILHPFPPQKPGSHRSSQGATLSNRRCNAKGSFCLQAHHPPASLLRQQQQWQQATIKRRLWSSSQSSMCCPKSCSFTLTAWRACCGAGMRKVGR